MRIAIQIAKASYCKRLQVGAVLVTTEGIIVPGYNGTLPGNENCCEDKEGNTKPETLHAERNMILKLANSTLSARGGTVYVTHSPCDICAGMLVGLGIKELYYKTLYRDNKGLIMLQENGVKTYKL